MAILAMELPQHPGRSELPQHWCDLNGVVYLQYGTASMHEPDLQTDQAKQKNIEHEQQAV